jgi:hypothetical protein
MAGFWVQRMGDMVMSPLTQILHPPLVTISPTISEM